MSELMDSFNIASSPYLKAAITILFFMITAKVLDIFIAKFMKRFTRFTKTEIDDRLIERIHRPLFFTVVFIGIVLSISYLELSQNIIFYVRGVFYSIVVIIWLITFTRISNLLVGHLIRKQTDVTGLRKDMIPFIENISKIALLVAALTALLSLWKVNITPLIASAGNYYP